MYTFFPEGESVLTAGSKMKQCPGKLTTRLSVATRPEEILATEQGRALTDPPEDSPAEADIAFHLCHPLYMLCCTADNQHTVSHV